MTQGIQLMQQCAASRLMRIESKVVNAAGRKTLLSLTNNGTHAIAPIPHVISDTATSSRTCYSACGRKVRLWQCQCSPVVEPCMGLTPCGGVRGTRGVLPATQCVGVLYGCLSSLCCTRGMVCQPAVQAHAGGRSTRTQQARLRCCFHTRHTCMYIAMFYIQCVDRLIDNVTSAVACRGIGHQDTQPVCLAACCCKQ